MKTYRVYLLDEAGHIRRAREMDCANDGEAIARARLLAAQQGVEVWERARLVSSLPPPNPALAS